jgi:cytochrome c oxidase subunit 4
MNTVGHYLRVTAVLLLLLVLTVSAAFLPLGPWQTAAAMLISGAKAFLILVFFMHLRKSNPLVRLFAAAGIFWLALLFALTLGDYLTRGR